ncbi:hypothetical protein [Sanguibacter sp. Z1732]|uniref:hypothetical protein n=1 Tax=Sanguibacter sp. Z1732 TaxID=3435412 RepID=UPI003D9C9036
MDEDLMSDVSLHLAHGELQALSHRRPDHIYWSRSTSGMTAVLARVGGLVLVQEGTTTAALDERTGAQVWREQVPLVAWRSLSDGRTLLSLDSASGRQVLSGVDVRTGELLFEVTGVEGPDALVRTERTYEGRLLVVTTAGLSMWSRPDLAPGPAPPPVPRQRPGGVARLCPGALPSAETAACRRVG